MAKELGPGKLLVLQYHSNDEYATATTEARVKAYNVTGFPTMFFDGGNRVLGGGATNYNQYSAAVTKQLAKRSPATIVGSMTISGSISIDVTVNNVSSSDITNVRLMAVIYENIGTEEHHYVVRDVLLPTAIASLSPGVAQKFNLKSALSGNLTGLKAVLFLQSQSNNEVLQSALATGG